MAGEVDSNELAMIREQIVHQGRQLKDLSQSNPTKVGILRDPELFALNSPENSIYNPETKGFSCSNSAFRSPCPDEKASIS